MRKWKYRHDSLRKRGGQYFYSDFVIELCLVLRKVYHLPLRQVTGFVKSILSALGIKATVPDYSTLCRRSRRLEVDLSASAKRRTGDIVIDSTGLKVYGEGEWKVRKHGAGKHRTWMKLHIAADSGSQQIESISLTGNAVDDAAEAEGLIKKIKKKIKCFYGDGAYDKDKVRKVLTGLKIKQVIPPQHNAVTDKKQSKHRVERDIAIADIKKTGRSGWKKKSRYHQRSKAETVMFRYKTIIGNQLAARNPENQKTEVAIGCKILNRMLQLTQIRSIKIN